MWGEFKSRFGWTAKAFLIKLSQENSPELPLLILSRRLIFNFTFTYIPWGPQLPAGFPQELRPQVLAQLASMLKPFLTRCNVFLRFDPPWQIESACLSAEQFLKAGFKQAAAAVQPPDTVIVNLEPSCEEILKAMKPKWRYNIFLAEKKGVQVKSFEGYETAAAELETFYNLLKETAARDGIAIHNIDYYRVLFEICSQKKENLFLRLYTASHEGEPLAAIVVLFRGEYVTYLYGASSSKKRNLMAAYALQWKAMLDAKEAGCKYYDLFGIPPNDDPAHPMAGLYRFKTGFSGQIIHRPGSWDYPYKKIFYLIFTALEFMRKKIRDCKKNPLFCSKRNPV
jgi:lipid II:glycine glycyltransferase (peptidoglycan interpeptide bridge formation enzyme)